MTQISDSPKESTTIKTRTYMYTPHYVEAVQVTEENLEGIAKWLGFDIRISTAGGEEQQFIAIPESARTRTKRGRAFVGDWIIKEGSRIKALTDHAFEHQITEAFYR